ncbi:MAG: hypothetical protein Q8865_02205 [Bacillota bacterium]|nr:hypothetical protein [Bacillota bacterium]
MPLAKLLSLTSLGLNGIWTAVLISHVLAAAASLLYYELILKRKPVKAARELNFE